MTNYSDLEFSRSLRDRVQARLTHLDLGSYELDWLDSRKVSEIETQLEWLDEAAAECRVNGDNESAETYEEILEVIQIESQLLFQSSSGGVASPRALEIRNEIH